MIFQKIKGKNCRRNYQTTKLKSKLIINYNTYKVGGRVSVWLVLLGLFMKTIINDINYNIIADKWGWRSMPACLPPHRAKVSRAPFMFTKNYFRDSSSKFERSAS